MSIRLRNSYDYYLMQMNSFRTNQTLVSSKNIHEGNRKNWGGESEV